MPKTNTSQKSFKPSLLALALLAPLGLVGLTGCGDDDGNTFNDFDGTPSVDAQTYSDAKLLQEPTVTKTLSRAELAEAIDAAGLIMPCLTLFVVSRYSILTTAPQG